MKIKKILKPAIIFCIPGLIILTIEETITLSNQARLNCPGEIIPVFTPILVIAIILLVIITKEKEGKNEKRNI